MASQCCPSPTPSLSLSSPLFLPPSLPPSLRSPLPLPSLSFSSSFQAAVATVVSAAGRIDIVVNNAGVALTGPVAETPLAEYRRVWETNVGGVVAVSQAVFPHMMKQKSGTILNVSSLAGFVAP